MLVNLLYIFLLIAGLKLIINLGKYIQCKYYYKKYEKWVTGKNPNMKRSQHQVINLFKEAGVKDSVIPIVEPLGLGQLATSNISVFDNFPNRSEQLISITIGFFEQSIGVYSSRTLETFNPIYWIEFIIYLPRNLFTYLGLQSDGTTVKLSQLFYWIAGLIFTLLFTAYSNEISVIVKDFISQLRY